jgi:hypothetical protein
MAARFTYDWNVRVKVAQEPSHFFFIVGHPPRTEVDTVAVVQDADRSVAPAFGASNVEKVALAVEKFAVDVGKVLHG